MKKIILNEKWFDRFVEYTIAHGSEHDESFASKEEMAKFQISEANPTMILTDDEEERLIGAASIIYREYYLRGNRARMRIFHVLKNNPEINQAYELLMEFVVEQIEDKGLSHAFMFIPLKEEQTIIFFKSMGMQVERYVFHMENTLESIKEHQFPENMELRNFLKGRDEDVWVKIRNEAFSNLTGNSTPITVDEIEKYIEGPDYVEGGMKILYEKEKPIGIIGLSEITENEETFAELGPVAVINDYRNKGLGKNLIRAGLTFATEKGYKKAGLSVDAQNQNAKNIYVSEGFKETEALICLRLMKK